MASRVRRSDDENLRPQSYESITTIPRWRIDNLLDAGFTPEQVQRIMAEEQLPTPPPRLRPDPPYANAGR